MATGGGGRPSRYLTKDGDSVPSVTTILGRFKDSSRLLHWAWRQGKEGLDYRQTRDNAASIGTVVHGCAERFILGVDRLSLEDHIISALPVVEDAVKGIEAFRSFLRWFDKHQPKITDTELPLVSERYRFAGCIDLVAAGPWQIDIKSGRGVYLDHALQIAAYDILHEEVRGERFQRFSILHIPKDGSECVLYDWADGLDSARAMFLALRTAYELEGQVEIAMKEAVKC
jgi:hypothetical protein